MNNFDTVSTDVLLIGGSPSGLPFHQPAWQEGKIDTNKIYFFNH